jgi:hypothetical protein
MSPRSISYAIAVGTFLSLAGFALAGNAGIDASVKGTDGHPAKNAQVRIEALDKKTPAVVVKPDVHGLAAIRNLDAGSYRVTAIVDGKVSATQVVKAAANKPTMVALKANQTTGTASAKGKKKMVWVPAPVGSRFGGYWKETGTADVAQGSDGNNVITGGSETMENMQQGQMRSAPPPAGTR